MKFLQDLLSDWGTGRLPPRRFALLYVAIIAIVLVSLVAAFAIFAAFYAHGSSRDAGWLASLCAVLWLSMFAGLFNIVVKRGRDLGLPGFVMGIGFGVLFVMGGIGVFLTILLALVPTGSFSSSRANELS
jgi:uncharacterized membrane protein YhaH (DUF805 family)